MACSHMLSGGRCSTPGCTSALLLHNGKILPGQSSTVDPEEE